MFFFCYYWLVGGSPVFKTFPGIDRNFRFTTASIMDFKLNTKENKGIWLSLGKSILLCLPVFAFILIPAVSHAGFWSNLFGGQDVSAQVETPTESSSSAVYEPVAPANNIDPTPKVAVDVPVDGQEALLPEVGPSTIAPDAIDNSSGQSTIYVVRKGDTFSSIAKMFNVSVNTVLWANDLNKNSSIKEGETLVILPISGVIHTVVAGDTLTKIAKKYAGDVNEISQFNDLAINDSLTPGDQIIIPDGEVSSSITISGSKVQPVFNAPDYGGYYIKPFVGGHQTQGLHGYHNSAVDWGMPVGTPLWAAAAGKVIISKNSGWNGGYGNYVIIQHPNNTQTIYGHMTNTIVSVGQTVTQGQLIGYSGSTGNSTGPHLHFEVRGAKNPFNFM